MPLSVQIEKKLGDFRLEASFEAEEEHFGLLGASGCGKSVTLRCIAGILKPDRGRIALDGRVLFDSEQGIDLKPQERRVGYLFQQYALFPNMTVRQNIEAAVRGSLAERQAAADRLLREFRIGEIAELRPGQISGGQKQRAALARILASEPALICLDEPFSALDSFLRRQLELGLSEMLSGFHGTVLWVSHDRGEIYRNCSRVCVMDHGKTLETAAVKKLFTRPETEAAARLAGCRNFAEALEADDAGSSAVRVPAWGLTLHCMPPLPDPFRKIGIRSESLKPAALSCGRSPDRCQTGKGGGGPSDHGPADGNHRENRFSCQVVREIEEPDRMSILLRPECAAEKAAGNAAGNADLLCMELSKEAWEETKRRNSGTLPKLEVSVPPEEILLLR